METYIPISFLNDFIFCPRSIYFHQLYGTYDAQIYQNRPQVEGKAAHKSIDDKNYSTQKNILQGLDVYSERYGICGKIDMYDAQSGRLTERKRQIKIIYDGYVFQTYAQYYGLTEIGYDVKSIVIYDMMHNKKYPIPLPKEDVEMQRKFEDLIEQINSFDMNSSGFEALESKCNNCIYSNLCDYSLC